jgi:hypothetical protein
MDRQENRMMDRNDNRKMNGKKNRKTARRIEKRSSITARRFSCSDMTSLTRIPSITTSVFVPSSVFIHVEITPCYRFHSYDIMQKSQRCQHIQSHVGNILFNRFLTRAFV